MYRIPSSSTSSSKSSCIVYLLSATRFTPVGINSFIHSSYNDVLLLLFLWARFNLFSDFPVYASLSVSPFFSLRPCTISIRFLSFLARFVLHFFVYIRSYNSVRLGRTTHVPQRSNFCYFRFYSIFYIQCPGPVQSHIIAVLTTFLKSSFYP